MHAQPNTADLNINTNQQINGFQVTPKIAYVETIDMSDPTFALNPDAKATRTALLEQITIIASNDEPDERKIVRPPSPESIIEDERKKIQQREEEAKQKEEKLQKSACQFASEKNPDNVPFHRRNLEARMDDFSRCYSIFFNNQYSYLFNHGLSTAPFIKKEDLEKIFPLVSKFISLFPPDVIKAGGNLRSISVLDFEKHSLYKNAETHSPQAFAIRGNHEILFDSNYVTNTSQADLFETIVHEFFHMIDDFNFEEDKQYRQMFESCDFENNCGQDRAVAFDSILSLDPKTGNVKLDAVKLQSDKKLRMKWQIFTGCLFDVKAGKFIKVMTPEEYTYEFGMPYKIFPKLSFSDKTKQILLDDNFWNALIDGKRVSWPKGDNMLIE